MTTKSLVCAALLITAACGAKKSGQTTGGNAASSSGGSSGVADGSTDVGLVPSHTLTVNVTGDGSVTSFPVGITCPGTCSEAVSLGGSLVLHAVPGGNAKFVGWSDPTCSGSACVQTISVDTPITASFAPLYGALSVTLAGAGHGSVTSDDGGINCFEDGGVCESGASGVALTLTATPDPGFYFVGWSGACTGTNTCQVTASGQQVTAIFSGIFFTDDYAIWNVGVGGQRPTLLAHAYNQTLSGYAGTSFDQTHLALSAGLDLSGADATGHNNIWVLDTVLGTFLPATKYTVANSNTSAPSLSADGSKLAFLSNRASGDSETTTANAGLWVANSDGSNAILAVAGSQSPTLPTLSPDGSLLAYFGGTPRTVVVCHSDGSSPVTLIHYGSWDGVAADSTPATPLDVPQAMVWSPDQSKIVVTGGYDMWLLDPQNVAAVVKLTAHTRIHTSVWWQAAFAGDNHTIYYSSERTSDETVNAIPWNIWSLDTSATAPVTEEQITTSNAFAPFLSPDFQTLILESTAPLDDFNGAAQSYENLWALTLPGGAPQPMTDSTTFDDFSPGDNND